MTASARRPSLAGRGWWRRGEPGYCHGGGGNDQTGKGKQPGPERHIEDPARQKTGNAGDRPGALGKPLNGALHARPGRARQDRHEGRPHQPVAERDQTRGCVDKELCL